MKRRSKPSRPQRRSPPGSLPPLPGPDARRGAIEALVASEEGGGFIDETLAARRAGLEPRDRGLLQELAYGAVRHLGTLDLLLNFHVKLPVARQKPAVAWALRVGAYQLVYLTRVPPHAAVNQTVEALKGCAGVDAKSPGFVNAVLHALALKVRKKTTEEPLERDDPTILPIRGGYCHLDGPVLPLVRMDLPGHLALKHSLPVWLVRRWLARFGEEEARLLCAAQNRIPEVTLRALQAAPSREAVLEALREEGIEARAGTLEQSIVLSGGGWVEGSATLARGWIQVQDETAQKIGAVLSPPPGARVLDLCAAPGGKAMQLLERIGPTGRLVAADRNEQKLELLRENLSRVSQSFALVVVPEDPDQLQLGEQFTHILIDAPCSNTGVLARRPEARWRVSEGELRALSALQSKLVDAAMRHLAPGGRLVYATCSIEPEENEEVAARAFASHPGLVERDTKLFLPHRTPGDGGFFSLALRST